MTVHEIAGFRVYAVAAEGALLGSSRDAIDLIGDTYGREIDLVAVPVSRLDPKFLDLRSGLAGEFLQKMTNYGLRFAIVGDIAAAVAASRALRDFVTESNRGGQTLFAADEAELERLLRR